MNRRPPASTLFPYPTLFRSTGAPGKCASTGSDNTPDCKSQPASTGSDDSGNHNTKAASTELNGAPNCKSQPASTETDRKSTRLNSSHVEISYAVFCLKKKKK